MRPVIPLSFVLALTVTACDEGGHKALCEEGPRPTFTHHVTDLSAVDFITPPGFVHNAGEIVGRTYIFLTDRTTPAPVYAPTDILLVAGSYYKDVVADAAYADEPDYFLNFQVNCDYELGFAHIKTLANDAIAAVFPSEPNGEFIVPEEPVRIEAGTLIGHMRSVDFFASDRTQQNQYVNQQRYVDGKYDNALYQVCPYDFWDSPMRDEYYALFGDNGARYPATECRPTSQDVAGTAAGQWFMSQETRPGVVEQEEQVDEDGYSWRLALARELAPSVKISKPGNRPFKVLGPDHPHGAGHPTYKDPAEINVGDTHCYQRWENGGDEGWLYVSVTSNTEMEVVFSETGTCPASFPGGGRTYYR